MHFLRGIIKVGTLATTGALMLVFSAVTPRAAAACTAVIGDFVWLDADGNGIQDAGEPGIAGVTVQLISGADSTTVLKTTLTDANGYYSFSGRHEPPTCELPFIIKVTTPPGLLPTLIGAGADPALDSNDPLGALVTPTDAPVWDGLAEDLTIDFGFLPPVSCTGSIGDLVWNDANNNGQQDAGEPIFASAVLTLSGEAAGTTSTSASGIYSFENLCRGNYTVCVDAPSGFQPSPDNVGDDASDSDGIVNGLGQSCANVTLAAHSTTDNTIDFGFWERPVQGPGTGTPGYWKNHPEAWPVDEITIGGVVYTKAQAIGLMESGDKDKSFTMFRHLVSAKLNVLAGNDSSCIATTIAAADMWMATYGPAGSGVAARSVAWKAGEPVAWELDAYNNGDRCAPHRD